MDRIVLCVDDDPDDRELIKNAIVEIDGSMNIAFASNGIEAMQVLRGAKQLTLPCLIIVDINMPMMDGKQTVLAIQDDPDLSRIPVVVFTTSSHPSDRDFCLRHGVELVTKPVNYRQISDEARRLLRHCSPS